MSFRERLKKLELAAAIRGPGCPQCGRRIGNYIHLIDAATGEKIEHWYCPACQVDALSGRKVQQFDDGIEPMEGAMIVAWPPGFTPTLACDVPIPETITHFIDV